MSTSISIKIVDNNGKVFSTERTIKALVGCRRRPTTVGTVGIMVENFNIRSADIKGSGGNGEVYTFGLLGFNDDENIRKMYITDSNHIEVESKYTFNRALLFFSAAEEYEEFNKRYFKIKNKKQYKHFIRYELGIMEDVFEEIQRDQSVCLVLDTVSP